MPAEARLVRRDMQAAASYSTHNVCSPSPAADSDEMQGNTQQRMAFAALRYTRSERAWTCLSMGCFDEACECSERENDIVAWAAALALMDNANKAQVALEAYIIATSTTLYEVLSSSTRSQSSSWSASAAAAARRSPADSAQGRANMNNDRALYQLLQRRDKVVAEWFAHRLAENNNNNNNSESNADTSVGSSGGASAVVTPAVRGEVAPAMQKAVLRHMLQLTDWREVHRWYIIALYLCGEDAAEYRAPQSRWFRNFVGLPDTHTYDEGEDEDEDGGVSDSETCSSGANATVESRAARVRDGVTRTATTATRQMDLRRTVTLLLASCAEADVHFITAVTAYKACRYRTCMIAASRVLEGAAVVAARKAASNEAQARLMPAQPTTRCGVPAAAVAAPGGGEATRQCTWHLRETEANFMRFVRAMAGLELGERMQAATDIVALMSQSANDVVFAVGSGMAVFGLGAVIDATPVLQRIAERWLRHYVFALCEYTHALTLAQLGNVGAALAVAQRAAPYAPRHDVGEQLSHLIVRLGVALEDADVLLATALSPERLLYIALSPAFFGGLTPNGIRLKQGSPAAALLGPARVPLYMSARQALPYYMHRAAQLDHQGRRREAWRAVQDAVAVADEVVGSLEFAFTDCFPLRVYAVGCHLGGRYVEALLQDEVAAAKRCLDDPHNVIAASEKAAVFRRNDRRVLAVLCCCRRWARQMRSFYPHAQLAESTTTLVAIMACDEHLLRQAIVLARRYPNHVAAQKLLMSALHSQLYIPEAVDAAERIGQKFPHAAEVATAVGRLLQREKGASYTFDYRTLVPIRYVSGRQQRLFTKRMMIVVLFLIVHVIIVCATVGVNMVAATSLPASVRPLAVRMQLPSVAPLYFAALCVVHAIVAVVTPTNLVHTLLQDVFFCDTPVNRLLFCLRGFALVNAFNALQISVAGNNFLLGVVGTVGLYAVLTVLFMPFTSRVWFLPSVDEPDIPIYSWLTLLAIDVVAAMIVILPHILLAALEPLMSIVFYLFLPITRPDRMHASTSVRRRLLYHKDHRDAMPARFSVGSGSRFVHIRCMTLLYYRTHSDMATKHRVEAELEEENYRVFPIIEPELVCDIAMQPLYTDEQIRSLMAAATSPTASSRAGDAASMRETPHADSTEGSETTAITATAAAAGAEHEARRMARPSSPSWAQDSATTSTQASTQSVTHTSTNDSTLVPRSPSSHSSTVGGLDVNDEGSEATPTQPIGASVCHASPPAVKMIDALKREMANMTPDAALRRMASFVTRDNGDNDDAASQDSSSYGGRSWNSLYGNSAEAVAGGAGRRPQSEAGDSQPSPGRPAIRPWPYNNEFDVVDYFAPGFQLGEMATANPYTSPVLEEAAQPGGAQAPAGARAMTTAAAAAAAANAQRSSVSQSDPVFDSSMSF